MYVRHAAYDHGNRLAVAGPVRGRAHQAPHIVAHDRRAVGATLIVPVGDQQVGGGQIDDGVPVGSGGIKDRFPPPAHRPPAGRADDHLTAGGTGPVLIGDRKVGAG